MKILGATNHSRATTLPPLPFYSFQSPSFPPSSAEMFLLVFRLKRAETKWMVAGLQLPELWLQEEGRQERTWRAKTERSEGGGRRAEGGGGQEKCCVQHSLKPN